MSLRVCVLLLLSVVSDVAIIYDYDNLWSLSFQPGFAGNSLQAAVKRYYNALARAGVNVDHVTRQANFSRYPLVLTPDLSILPDEVARTLDAYVKNGGVLLADYGKGKGWYVGMVAKKDAFYDNLIRRLLDDAGITPVVSPLSAWRHPYVRGRARGSCSS